MTVTEVPWWKDGVVYQIYPASFKDSNGDGVGDIQGIIQSLDYIKSVGVDIIWVCPMYESPQIDMGYDISDYKEVYAPYGTVEDMDTLIRETHNRGMRVILDLVINHTSDQHRWFQESKSSKDDPKRDWYIWRPAKYDEFGRRQPPNNWRSNFGGSVWEWDEHTQEYYLHLFCREQPDLNWENEETRHAIYQDAMIFWLEKGIDGFRIDTVNMYSKDPSFPDAPITDPDAEWQPAGLCFCNGPRMNEYLSEMNAILSRYDAMSVGECPHTPDLSTVLGYVGASQKRLNMVFQFDTVDVGMGSTAKYDTSPFSHTVDEIKRAVAFTQNLLSFDSWPTTFVENHDQARSISRFGDDSHQWREKSGAMLAMLFSSLSGTLFIYQGQEIGMVNMPMEWSIEEYKDVESSQYYKGVAERYRNDPVKLKEAHASLQHLARDHARTPMQWNASENGGFTTSYTQPWMRVNTSTKTINVADQLGRKSSLLAFWMQMLQLRKLYRDVLVHGEFQLVDESNEKVFSFLKRGKTREVLVLCNMTGEEAQTPAINGVKDGKLLLSNTTNTGASLEPWEGRIYLLPTYRVR